MRAKAVLAAALLLAGCEDPSVVEAEGGHVRLVVTPREPAAGTFPGHFLVNDSEQDVGYGRPYVLERRTTGGWSRVGFRCLFTLEGRSLAPHEQSPIEQVGRCGDEAPGLEAGVYRITKDVLLWGEKDDFVSRDLVRTFIVR